MDIKYIKVGKWYNVPFKVVEIKSGDIHMENGGIKAVCQPRELSEITSVERTERLWNGMCDVLFDDNGQNHAADLSQAMRNHIKSITPDTENVTKNTETAQKYDPNRIFSKGDKVRLVKCNGRNPFDSFNGIEYPPDETIYTVEGDEYDNGKVELYAMDSCDVFEIHHSNIELVTPVEELEPYIVKNIIKGYAVYKRDAGDLAASCVFWSKYHPNAKEAAEAECKRLNEEYRK